MKLLFPRSALLPKYLAIILALALLLPTLALHVSAQEPTSPKTIDNEHFLIYQDTNGDTVCRAANAREKIQLDRIVPKNLRQINHAGERSTAETFSDNDLPQHLTIILRATAHLDANADAKAAFLRAAAAWESVVTSPVTIYLDADLGADNFGAAWESGVLGATSSPSLNSVNYTLVRGNLIAGANTPAKAALYNALPANSLPTDMGSATSVSVSSSIARAIGLLDPTAQSTDNASRIGFNSSFSFDFNHSDGVNPGQIDFEAVATHEIGHALGFTSRSGSGSPTPAMWDLYRFRSGTSDATFTTAQRIMTLGGPTLNSQYYFVPGAGELGLSDGGPSGSADNNADGNQSSHWRQQSKNGGVLIGIMDPRIPNGVRRDIMPNDSAAMSVFGYNSNAIAPPPPPFNDNFANAQILSGCSGSVSGTNIGATHETGEPNHSPDNGGGNRSIWFQWQAPVSGSVNFNTAGSGFDTVLGVYTGTTVGGLVPQGKNDDATPGSVLTSTVTFNATAGIVYSIAVDGYNNGGSGGDVGPVTLNWSQGTCTGTWSPTTLTPGQVDFKTWTINTHTSVYVKLTFPDAGYRVANWGSPTRSGNDFSVDTAVEKFNGVSAQAITNTAQIWDLGVLAVGNYTFAFKNSGATVKTLGFTVTNTVPAPNPIDDAREFVRWQYKDFLRREPDLPGWDHWTAEITMCSNVANRFPGETEPQCVDRKRENTSAAFFLSPEFQNTGYFVLRVYRGSLGRMPHFGGTGGAGDEFTTDAATVAQGIVVNDALAPNVINANKQAFVNQFVTRSEFRAIYDGLSNTQYVDKLFQTTGVTPTASDRQALIDGLNNSSETRASVLFKVVDGTQTIAGGALIFNTTYGKAFYDNLFNAAFVQMEYFGYLLRDPDPDGYAFWLGKLNGFANWIDAEMVRAFIKSPEYRARFGAP